MNININSGCISLKELFDPMNININSRCISLKELFDLCDEYEGIGGLVVMRIQEKDLKEKEEINQDIISLLKICQKKK